MEAKQDAIDDVIVLDHEPMMNDENDVNGVKSSSPSKPAAKAVERSPRRKQRSPMKVESKNHTPGGSSKKKDLVPSPSNKLDPIDVDDIQDVAESKDDEGHYYDGSATKGRKKKVGLVTVEGEESKDSKDAFDVIGSPMKKAKIEDMDLKPQAKPTSYDKPIEISTSPPPDSAPNLSDLVQSCIDVFPDCDPTYAKSLLRRFRCTEFHHVPAVLDEMATNGYDRRLGEDYRNEDTVISNALGMEKVRMRDYESNGWKTSSNYRLEACKYLTDEFPFLSVSCIRPALENDDHKGHLASFVSEITEIMGYAEVQMAKGGGRVSDVARQRLKKRGIIIVKNGRTRKILVHPNWSPTDPILIDEIDYVKKKYENSMEVADVELARQLAREDAEKEGGTVECACCYGDVAFEEMCQCSEGHLFCLECLRRYGEEQLFGAQKTNLDCMTQADSGGKCLGTFSQDMIKRALPKKVLEKLEEAMFMSAVESAGVENLCRCPKCDFQAVVDSKVMVCPAVGCGYESCRDCGEPPHFPLKCDEVEKQSHAESRKRVEEAMTAARVRICPNENCGKRFYKVEGCNKMSCACGTTSCYYCREQLDKSMGYKHFCQTPHCNHKSCGKCPLFTDSVADDRLAMRDAGIKAARENNLGLNIRRKGEEDEPDLDIEQLLEGGSNGAAARAAAAAQEQAHLGVGAMARAAYNEIENRGRRRQQEEEGE
eukprot:CAMPEP_0118634836 /NCGR_PEP_ID=MMETSP0785-20121206/1759_1 /TAXON_ID=91992 /ORGANISM="Bolidomonas pacifica, Strain CCMP 1866" /LENGTH=710 /DNA_ID=CAMNT_0006525837 /DNA_START=87 /DNA_END=2216 /DNA_ORIENTATION=+